jgi:hypothetical protein
MAKANQYIEVIRNDIAENRRNLNNPDYVPHDVPGYIRRMRIYGFPWPSQLVCPPSGCRRAEDISGGRYFRGIEKFRRRRADICAYLALNI